MAVNVVPLGELNANFTDAGDAAGQPRNAAEIGKYDSLTTLESALPASISATDKIPMTVNDKVFAARHKITAWTATTFNLGDYVTHLGKFWYASTAAISTDVPGTAGLWKATGAPYIN